MDSLSNSVPSGNKSSLCVVTPYWPSLTETFIRSHIEELPAEVTHVYGWRPTVDGRTVLTLPQLAYYKVLRTLTGASLEVETAQAYLKLFRERKVNAVLAEYGETGVQVMRATEQSGIPLVVHFHGYDASVKAVLDEHRESYPRMFEIASAIVVVSRSMQTALIGLGAPPRKIHYNPYGVDCARFGGAKPGEAPPLFIAVGRFTEKKAPDITLSAFARVHKIHKDVRLKMIGEGPLLESCRALASKLGIEQAVTFLGAQSHEVIQNEMRSARCFVQHSIVASSGDCEGTPVSIIEAGATGLPVVSTVHAGIPDVVVEGVTGFLVKERDEITMAEHMLRFVSDPALATTMGIRARTHIQQSFSKERSLKNLWSIINSVIDK